jgi:DNA-binding NarL/FixJ family response regulator
LRILLADPDKTALRNLADFLNQQPGITVIGEAVDAKGLLSLIRKQPADVVVIDFALPGRSLIWLIDAIHTSDSPAKVILISSEPENARRALSTGADSFVSKSEQPEWLLDSLSRLERTET